MADQPAGACGAESRRSTFARLAGAVAMGLAGWGAAPRCAVAGMPVGDGSDWPGKLTARHRQVVDAVAINGGFPLDYVHTFLITNPGSGMASGVLVLRGGAMPIGLSSAMWAKYRIGEALKVTDPETGQPAVKNPFLQPKPGVLQADAMALGRLLAVGTIVGVCNIALHGLSRKLAGNAGVSAAEAATEWTANIVAGVSILPSGTWGVNRAQEAGCTYCAGG